MFLSNSWRCMLLLAILGTVHGTQVAAEEIEETIDFLSDAHRTWLESIEFRSTYTLREGTAHSLQDALDGAPLKELVASGGGLFHKKGTMRRISIEFDGGPVLRGRFTPDGKFVEAPPDNGDGRLTLGGGHRLLVERTTSDEVNDLDLCLTYVPKWRNANDHATFYRRSDNPARMQMGGCSTLEMELSPLNPSPGCNFDPFGGDSLLADALPTFEITALEQDRISVVVHSTAEIDGTQYRQRQEVVWWTEPPIPVIERVHRVVERGTGEPFLERISELSGFRECAGGYVARNVVFASQSGRAGTAPVRVKEWRSSDLGDEAPNDDDFVIEIPASTAVIGLKDPPPPGRERRLRLADYTSDAVRRPDRPEAVRLAEAVPAPVWRSLLVWVNLTVLLLILVSVFAWRRWLHPVRRDVPPGGC